MYKITIIKITDAAIREGTHEVVHYGVTFSGTMSLFREQDFLCAHHIRVDKAGFLRSLFGRWDFVCHIGGVSPGVDVPARVWIDTAQTLGVK